MFKSLNGGIIPKRATKYSAGFDVFANEDVVIGAGETKLIGLGIALDEEQLRAIRTEQYKKCQSDLDKTYYFALHIRSSLRAKGLTSLGTGIIDMDYRDEINMVIHNPIKIVCYSNVYGIRLTTDFNDEYEIKKGDKIWQLILCRHEGWLLPSEYTKDEERNGGFGSTGDSK